MSIQSDNTPQIMRLINKFNEYYDSNHNHKEAAKTVEALCFLCEVDTKTLPKYSDYSDITLWYQLVYLWLRNRNILE